jgi:hypothetical protein
MEIDNLREKVVKCEDIIKDQKFIINGQKEEIFKVGSKAADIETSFQMEIEFMRKQLDDNQR